jgi:hypothetical protein
LLHGRYRQWERLITCKSQAVGGAFYMKGTGSGRGLLHERYRQWEELVT